ncbi:COMPASS component SWD2, partial [Tremellales sp. Uapishka_1]
MTQPTASSSKPRVAVPLTHELLQRFKPSKVFKDAVDHSSSGPDSDSPRLQITSIAFDDSGEKCVTAGEDDVFNLWDARKGKKVKTLYSKKYGIDHARFTHRSQNIIHASTKLNDHAIRYHAMVENKYLSYFRGHTGRVRSLQMNPNDDTFLSAGDDGTVRLWDLRSPNCRGLLNDIGGSSIAAFDSSGIVFAVACSDTQTIMLYDCTSLDNVSAIRCHLHHIPLPTPGIVPFPKSRRCAPTADVYPFPSRIAFLLVPAAPFTHASLIDLVLADESSPPPKPIFTSLSFSNDGTYLLVGTSLSVHYVLDAFSLSLVRRLKGHSGLGLTTDIVPRRGTSGEEVSWSSDSKWVVSGSKDGQVVFWDIAQIQRSHEDAAGMENRRSETLLPQVVVEAERESRAVKFNPRYAMLAVGGEELSFWLPAVDEDAMMKEGY